MTIGWQIFTISIAYSIVRTELERDRVIPQGHRWASRVVAFTLVLLWILVCQGMGWAVGLMGIK